jgi:hypothetical protein
MVTRHGNEGASLFGDRMSNSSAPKAYGTGRRCQADGCRVLLSRYNSTDWCARHESTFFISKHPPLPDADGKPTYPVAS